MRNDRDTTPPFGDFWSDDSVERLAERQGVKPIVSIDQLVGGWPENESVDEFIAMIRDARR